MHSHSCDRYLLVIAERKSLWPDVSAGSLGQQQLNVIHPSQVKIKIADSAHMGMLPRVNMTDVWLAGT